MKRIELFEFEDFHWLPSTIRTGVTNLIKVLHRATGTANVIADLILSLRAKYNFTQITDMGSGSGGPMLDVIRKIHEQDEHKNLNLLLSDFYPNADLVNSINNQKLLQVKYSETPVDATDIGNAPTGLKTMIASFHHMPPEMARRILLSAQANKQPIFIYEIAQNNVPILLWWLLLPVSLTILIAMALVMTFFVRPLRLSQIVFTFLIPVIPLVYAWDGQTSLVRTYTEADIRGLLNGDITDDYCWTIENAKSRHGTKMGYYIAGYPKG